MSKEVRTKVVVRLLPPSLTEESFKEVIGEWIQACDWVSYWKGKPSAGAMGHSRAYLNFRDPADVYSFKLAFDGHAFLTERGTQQRCSVEYAPNQRVARGKGKRDHREGTIEKDADYKQFLKQLEDGTDTLPSAEVQLQRREEAAAAAGSGGKGAVVETALMEYLRQKRAKKAKRTAAGKAVKGGRAKGVPVAVSTAGGKGGKREKKKGKQVEDITEATIAKKRPQKSKEKAAGGGERAAASIIVVDGGKKKGRKLGAEGAPKKGSTASGEAPSGALGGAEAKPFVPGGASAAAPAPAPKILVRKRPTSTAGSTADAAGGAPALLTGQPKEEKSTPPRRAGGDAAAGGPSSAGTRSEGAGRGSGGGRGRGRRGGRCGKPPAPGSGAPAPAPAPRVAVLKRPPGVPPSG